MATSTAAASPKQTSAKPPALKAPAASAKVKKPLSANAYIGIVIAIVALIVIVCGFISYRLLGHIILDVKVLSKEATAKSQLTQKLKDASTLVNNYNNLGSNQQQLIADALPTDPQFTQLVAVMDKMATTAGVSLRTLSPSSTVGGSAASASSSASSSSSGAAGGASGSSGAGGASGSAPSQPSPYVFSGEVQGPYAQIVNFFHNIELSVRPMRVVDETFISTGDTNTIKADFDLQTYYQGKANVSDKTEVIK